jgi:hypothetical protein
MFRRKATTRIALLVLFAGVVAVPVYAGSAVIGSVAGSKDATVGGQVLVPNTTLFSGDSLQVKEGVAVIALGQGSRMVFGHQTQASFVREGDEVTVLLGTGNVSLYHPEAGVAMKVKAGPVVIAPAKGFKTLGQVAMLNGSVVITAKEGKLNVEGNGPAVEVAKGKTITLKTKPAAAPQAGGAAAVSGLTAGQVASIAGAGAAGVGAGFSIAARSKASDALAAAQDATAAAEASTDVAKAACQAVTSPSVPSACQ